MFDQQRVLFAPAGRGQNHQFPGKCSRIHKVEEMLEEAIYLPL